MPDSREGPHSGQRDEVAVRAVLRVPGQPDKEVVVQMPEWAVPVKKEKSRED